MAGNCVVAGIFALGAEGDMYAGFIDIACDLEAELVSGFEAWDDQLFGGAGVGGAFEDNELALFDVGSDGFDGFADVAEVGLVVVVERGGNADDDRVHLGNIGVVSGGAEAGFLRLLDLLREDADNVGAAAVERLNLGRLDIEASDAKAFIAKEQGEGKADVAHADDANAGFAGFEFALEGVDLGKGWAGGVRADCCGGHLSLIVTGWPEAQGFRVS